MWLEEAEELFKGYLPYYVLIVLPIFIIISPANPVSASHEFPVYRMHHLDLYNTAYGSRSASINLEARSLSSWTTSRHCVIARFQDLTVDLFQAIRARAGGLIVVLPREIAALAPDERQHLLLLESAMMAQEVSIPVYFARWNSQLDAILAEVAQTRSTSGNRGGSAAEALLTSVAANGYQFVVSAPTPILKPDIRVATLQGSLPGYGADGKVGSVAIVAHYDSFGVAPNLSFGADSNGSGVAVLLELVRLFSHLYADPKTRGRFNIVFALTGGGKINYQGSKKWIEDQVEILDGSLLQDTSFVVCLDTLTASDSLYMHVSKPPKENSPAFHFFKELKTSADKYPEMSVDGVHKKINLADEMLAWEHERFSIKKIPAFTLSTLKSHRDNVRTTILDTLDNLDVDRLNRNTKVLAESLARYIYNVSGDVFGGSLDVDKDFIGGWIKYLTSQPRSSQLITNKDNSLVAVLKDNFNKYLRDVRVYYAGPEKRDPDFQFYEVSKGMLYIYSVKPAVFDLILTLAIILYLGTVYLLIQKFSTIYNIACNLTSNKMKQN